MKFLDKLKDPLILLLFAASFVSILLGEIDDAISIAVAVLIVSTVGFVQEYKSEQYVSPRSGFWRFGGVRWGKIDVD